MVITPRLVYIGLEGFFFTPMIGTQKVAFSSGWVTWAFFILRPIGRINLSNLGGFRVKLSSTNVTLVTILFQPFLRDLPDFNTLNTSVSDWALERMSRVSMELWSIIERIMLALPDGRYWNLPLSCLLFPLLFDHAGDRFGLSLLFSVEQIGWHCSGVLGSLS